MTKPNSTDIVFVVDRSVAMCSIATDMKGGFDTFIQKQKETPGECHVTLTEFDDLIKPAYVAKPLNDVPLLSLCLAAARRC